MPRTADAGTCAQRVRLLGGVIRQTEAIAAGFTKRSIAGDVQRGELLRVRRSWLAVPDADPMLIAAARAGVVISCTTRAKRLGLWVMDDDRPHVAAPPRSGGVAVDEEADAAGTVRRKAQLHWAAPVVPRHPHALEDSVENSLVLIAQCQPKETALAVWESALNKRLVDRKALERLRLPAAAREVLDNASPFSDSGLETFVLVRLRWIRVRIIPQVWILGHRVDFLIGERLVLQADGAHHVGAQREEDIAHDAVLMLHGYHVIRVGYHQVIDDWPAVQDRVMRAVAQGLHRA